jgi:hypothetical protein
MQRAADDERLSSRQSCFDAPESCYFRPAALGDRMICIAIAAAAVAATLPMVWVPIDRML